MVAISYRWRAIPLAWTWVKAAREHSSAYKRTLFRPAPLRPVVGMPPKGQHVDQERFADAFGVDAKEPRPFIAICMIADKPQAIRLPVHGCSIWPPLKGVYHPGGGPIAVDDPHLTVGKGRHWRTFLTQEGNLPAIGRPVEFANAELARFAKQLVWF